MNKNKPQTIENVLKQVRRLESGLAMLVETLVEILSEENFDMDFLTNDRDTIKYRSNELLNLLDTMLEDLE